MDDGGSDSSIHIPMMVVMVRGPCGVPSKPSNKKAPTRTPSSTPMTMMLLLIAWWLVSFNVLVEFSRWGLRSRFERVGEEIQSARRKKKFAHRGRSFLHFWERWLEFLEWWMFIIYFYFYRDNIHNFCEDCDLNFWRGGQGFEYNDQNFSWDNDQNFSKDHNQNFWRRRRSKRAIILAPTTRMSVSMSHV